MQGQGHRLAAGRSWQLPTLPTTLTKSHKQWISGISAVALTVLAYYGMNGAFDAQTMGLIALGVGGLHKACQLSLIRDKLNENQAVGRSWAMVEIMTTLPLVIATISLLIGDASVMSASNQIFYSMVGYGVAMAIGYCLFSNHNEQGNGARA